MTTGGSCVARSIVHGEQLWHGMDWIVLEVRGSKCWDGLDSLGGSGFESRSRHFTFSSNIQLLSLSLPDKLEPDIGGVRWVPLGRRNVGMDWLVVN